ncbi:MurR/RpiR family transcriptional regulator [Sporomusa acidovorans]|uniref:HTH-type transcriptional regulator YbbH n=1 Tax=Sporomusa acidovorans (strain ATCC 49682 / DSM 3132 / Mol) TaxID=1123286 RepID=A0ABZ3J9K5_SPOA4|nr:MurR/RpiR family transcriptional regulator [Sporomusa acidovorans]OZC16153.1 putative HTH-type transcriptional regulator YbbH [Sporomusa acidovorans DSM 3132]SDE29279.1 transcriptional regulator, RpiR family [Sporomusa acidovorans]
MSIPAITAIKNQLPSLTEAESKIAHYILNNVEDIIYLTVGELASRADSSEATVVRFCKSVGYKGFQDLKINFAKYIVNPQKVILEDYDVNDTLRVIKRKVFQSRIQAISDTLAVLNDDEFERAVAAINTANRLEFYGTGASAYVGINMKHQFLKIGKKCGTELDTDTQAISASLLGPGDVAIGISHTGSSVQTIRCLRLAKEVGATTIALTNQAKSPILKVSDIVLFTAAKETNYKYEGSASRLAEFTVLDALLIAYTMNRYEECKNAMYITRSATSDGKI